MRIAPHFTAADWMALTFATEADWQRAIDIFVDRIRGRFLQPINMIKDQVYAGFAVMALDCLLIETLYRFQKGIDRPGFGGSDDAEGRYSSKTAFKEFLTTTSFGQFFDERKAINFYQQIRSGILHNAETDKNSRIRIRSDEPLVTYAEDNESLVINRTLFHAELERVFESYVLQLRDPAQEQLRRNFRRKMDAISRGANSGGIAE